MVKEAKISLLLLTPVLVTTCSCSNDADLNYKAFEIVSEKCMDFYKSIYCDTFEKEGIDEFHLGDMRIYSGKGYELLYVYSSLVFDKSFPVTTKTIGFKDHGEEKYFKYYSDKKNNFFCIEVCECSEVGMCADADCGSTVRYDYYRLEINFDYSSSTVKNAMRYSDSVYKDYPGSDYCYIQEFYVEDGDYKLDIKHRADKELENSRDNFLGGFKRSERVEEDFGEKIDKLENEAFKERMSWGDDYRSKYENS